MFDFLRSACCSSIQYSRRKSKAEAGSLEEARQRLRASTVQEPGEPPFTSGAFRAPLPGHSYDPYINKVDIKWRYFSFVKIDCRHTLIAALASRSKMPAPRRKQWETQMTKTSFRTLAISLRGTLNQIMDVCSHLVRSEIPGNDRSSLLLRLGPADERRLRPALIPIRSSPRRPRQRAQQPASSAFGIDGRTVSGHGSAAVSQLTPMQRGASASGSQVC